MKQDTYEKRVTNLSNVFHAFKYWPRIFRLLWQASPVYLVFVIVLSVVGGSLPVLVLLTQQELINAIVDNGLSAGYELIAWAFCWMVGAMFLSQGIVLLRGYFEPLFEAILNKHVSLLIMQKANALSLADYENATVQDQLKRAQAERGGRIATVVTRILIIISSVMTLVSTTMLLIVWKWWVAFVVIAIPILSFISFLKVGRDEFDVHWHRMPKQRKSWYLTHLVTQNNSFKEIKLYQLGGYMFRQYQHYQEAFYEEDKKLIRKRTLISTLFHLVNLTVISAMILLVVSSALLREITIGNVVALIQAVRTIESTAQSIVHGIIALCQNNLYLEQTFQFLDFESNDAPDKPAERDALELIADIPEIETIEFCKVSFRYPGTERYALQDVSFTIRKGETVAVVGRNGAGKSTLVKLFSQLYSEYEGEILLNGLSIRRYDREAFQRKIGIVFQDFVQYEMPMRQNIGFGDLSYLEQDEKLMQAAESAGIGDMVNRLPQKMETQLGRLFEAGQQLSGGQWQRVAIARAFLREADVYLLDEPSSFLDPQAEGEVFAKFRQLVAGRMGIYISHRYSSVSFSDKILVMEHGRLVELGSHQELMECDGIYAGLYKKQIASLVKQEEAVS